MVQVIGRELKLATCLEVISCKDIERACECFLSCPLGSTIQALDAHAGSAFVPGLIVFLDALTEPGSLAPFRRSTINGDVGHQAATVGRQSSRCPISFERGQRPTWLLGQEPS